MKDWKLPDVSAAGMISRNNQKGLSLSLVNETENLKELFDTSKTPIIKLEFEAEKEIKERPKDEVFMEGNEEDLVNVRTHSEEDNPLPIGDETKVQALVCVQKRKSEKIFKCVKCEICLKVFTHNGALFNNKKRHKVNSSKCEYCLKVFRNTLKLHRHIKVARNMTVCFVKIVLFIS